MEPIIRIENLTKEYRKIRAVDDLSLEVEPGQVFGFLGPNGAGKSTTIRVLLGLIRPTSGDAWIAGINLIKSRKALAKIGAIIEAPGFYDNLTARLNLEIFLTLHRIRDFSGIDRILDLVGLLGRENEPVAGYSHGMRQRLGIARAILHSPPLVILDEPSDGLDPRGRRQMRQILRDIVDELGITVFLSSHLLNEMEELCNRVAIINKGRLLYSGSVEDLKKENPAVRIWTERLENAVRLLEGNGDLQVSIGDRGELLVSSSSGEVDPAAINRSLVGEGFQVRAIQAVDTLEECFLRLTESTQDQNVAATNAAVEG